MAPKINFIDKVFARIDRLDRDNIQSYLSGLVQAKKESEEVFDHIGEGILILEEGGVVRSANRNSFLWLGFDRLIKGRSRIEDLIQEPLVKQFVLERLRTPAERASEEFQMLTPREIEVRLHWIPLEGEDEKRVLLRIENLTPERSRFDEDARFERVESLIRLAAGVAHEIGNPLNSIQIHIELLKQEVLKLAKTRQKSFDKIIRVIASETKRLDQIVRSFLRATRNPPLRFRLESINEVIEEAIEFLHYELEKKRVRITLSLDKALPQFLMDRNRLHQTFINLIKNGVEAMPKGGELRVSAALKDKLCLIRFQDQGKGIDEKDLPHIFEAYYTTKEEGSGLGLAQVYQAVREHGGRIDVKSERGRGSVFTLVLPVRKERLSLPQPR